jgi:hypothetical protein
MKIIYNTYLGENDYDLTVVFLTMVGRKNMWKTCEIVTIWDAKLCLMRLASHMMRQRIYQKIKLINIGQRLKKDESWNHLIKVLRFFLSLTKKYWDLNSDCVGPQSPTFTSRYFDCCWIEIKQPRICWLCECGDC